MDPAVSAVWSFLACSSTSISRRSSSSSAVKGSSSTSFSVSPSASKISWSSSSTLSLCAVPESWSDTVLFETFSLPSAIGFTVVKLPSISRYSSSSVNDSLTNSWDSSAISGFVSGFWSSRAVRSTSISLFMSTAHPQSFAASLAFWPSFPMANERCLLGTTATAVLLSWSTSTLSTSDGLRAFWMSCLALTATLRLDPLSLAMPTISTAPL